jgi:hypothetical protein
VTKYTRCTVEGCEGKHRAKGYCYPHYMRQYKTGNLGGTAIAPMWRSTDFPDLRTKRCGHVMVTSATTAAE